MQSLQIPPGQGLSDGDSVLFFPTYGALDATGKAWRIPIHGVVLQRSKVSRNRNAIFALIRRYLARDLTAEQRALFDARSVLFRVKASAGRRLAAKVGGFEVAFEKTSRQGYFRGQLEVPAEEAFSSAAGEASWASVELAHSSESPLNLGSANLLGRRGVSIISDIDDTIKVTEVWNRRRMLENTFLRDFVPVQGMPELYQHWQSQGAAFHYVSASPWQLSEALWGFLQTAYPLGSLHLKLRVRRTPWWKFLARGNRGKLPILLQLLEAFPEREFVLVGDTSSQDPAHYAHCLEKYPRQVRRILLRNIRNGKWTRESLARRYREFSRSQWALVEEDDWAPWYTL